MIKIIPFGDIEEDRFQISKDYKLIELKSGIWRLTEKARKNYDPLSFIIYLRGKIEKPLRVSEVKPPEKIKDPEPVLEMTPRQEIIQEIMLM